jgi:hypothetical protein
VRDSSPLKTTVPENPEGYGENIEISEDPAEALVREAFYWPEPSSVATTLDSSLVIDYSDYRPSTGTKCVIRKGKMTVLPWKCTHRGHIPGLAPLSTTLIPYQGHPFT